MNNPKKEIKNIGRKMAGPGREIKNPTRLSDPQLYAICKKWGAEALAARRKFAGLLPEVYRRERESGGMAARLSWLEKRGFSCIYEFAARLAGMSRKQVDLVLALERRFETLPLLRTALVEGEISANKLARVATVATPQNQNDVLKKAQILSSRALEVYVKDIKQGGATENQNGCNKTKNGTDFLHVQKIDFEYPNVKNERESKKNNADGRNRAGYGASDAEILNALSPELKAKILELKKKNIDVNVLFLEFLQKREHEINEQMAQMGEEQLEERKEKHIIGKPSSRYVPARIKKIVAAKFGTVCTAAGCGKPAVHLHHERRFASFGSHDPRHLRPLCKAHHELEHAGEYVRRG